MTHSGSGVGSASRSTWVAFALMVVFVGGSPVAIRLSNQGLPPFWGAAMRYAIAALVFWALVLVRRLAVPRSRALWGVIIYGFLSVAAAPAFLYWGIQRVPASLAGPFLALVPLMTFFFAWVHRLEAYRWQGLVGAALAAAGVLLGVVGGFEGAVHVPSLLALVAGAACLGESGVILKLFPPSHPMVTNAVSLTAGAPVLFVLSWLLGEAWTLPATPSAWAAFAYLVLIGSVVVFSLYLHVLSRWTASATSYVFLLSPVATVAIAAWLLGEMVTVAFLIGAALVLAGVWVGVIRSAPKVVELVCSETPNKAIC